MSRAVTTVETALVVLVIVAILISAVTLVNVMAPPAGIAELSSTVEELAAAERDLASVVADLGKAVGAYAERIAAIEERLGAVEEELAKPPAPGAIKIGGVAPLSAPGAYASGVEMRMAMLMAVEEINAAGGVLGRELRIIVEDSGGLPEKGAAAMEKLIAEDEVVGVVGEFHSSVAKAEIGVAHKYGVPFIVAEAWSDSITAAGYREVFRIAPAVTLFYTKLAEFYVDQGFKNVVMIAEETDWGMDVKRIFTEVMEAAGVKITTTTADIAATEFRPKLREWAAMTPPPDLLIDCFTGTGGYLIIAQAYEIGLAPTKDTALFSVSTSTLYPELWETAGEAAVYVMTKTGAIPGLELSPKTGRFTLEFEAKYGRKPSFAAMECYDGVYVLADAIERAGSTEPSKIIEALEGLVEKPYTGTLGDIYFSLETTPDYMYHQWPGIRAFIIQYSAVGQDWTEAEVIYPPELATSEILWPE
ncbi:MAG: ABC transporter substrate-binding protein [Candidatus Bathyarchaeia archaeon]